MAENVLSQAEVDALLKAMDTGELGVKKAKAGPKKNCTKYDFKCPNLIPKDSLRILKAIQENFARSFSQSLSGMLRYPIQMALVSIDQLTYGEFLMSLPDVQCLNIIGLEPLKGRLMLEFNINIILAFIDRLMGGEGKPAKKVRTLTDLEEVILAKILKKFLEDFKSSWKQVIDFSLQIENMQADSRVVQVARPNESVVLFCFEIKYGKTAGLVNLCMPSLVFELIISKLKTSFKTQEVQVLKKANEMREVLVQLPLSLNMVIDKVSLKSNEVLNLQNGDIIKLNKKIDSDVKVMIDKWHFFNAKPCFKNKKKAVVLTQNFFTR